MPPKIDTTIQEEQAPPLTGEYGLWLRVTLDAVTCLLNGWNSQAAREYVFDTDNDFFIYVCANLGVEPEAAREHIRERLVRRYQSPQVESSTRGQSEGPD